MQMNANAIIGVDIGTTSTKTIAYDEKGVILAEADHEYPLYSPKSTWKEQDPEEIFQAVIDTLSTVFKTVAEQEKTVAGVGFSAAMHSLIAVNRNGNLLTRAIIWADQRSVAESEELKASGAGHEIYLRTGTPIHPMSPLTKLLWFRKHNKEIFDAADKWISIKEYVFYRLFHQCVVDYSIASATGLFHLKNLDWDEEALQLTGITKEQLSEPVPTTHLVTGLDPEIARDLDIPEETPFIVGASDGVLANLGVGAIEHGSVACSIGTSGAIRTVVSEPTTDPKGRIFCYALTEDQWVIGGPINNGGIAFRWLGDKMMPDLREKIVSEGKNPYDEMTKLASEVDPGADGLLFLPYLTGERAPYWNADTKGVFIGLTLNHGQNQIIRSVLEGVIFQMYTVVIALKDMGVEPFEYRANGGFARSELWRQMMADIFETDILVPESYQSSCFGAALLSMKALGFISDFSSVKDTLKNKVKHEPIEDHAAIYRELKPIFIRLSRQLTSEFKALSDFQRGLENKNMKGED
jgi:gluconokinase